VALALSLVACATVARPTFDEIRHGTLRGIAETPIGLRDGAWVGPELSPGGASRLHVVLWSEPVAFGDLDGQPGDEAVVLAGASTGGSGSFVYIAAFARRDGRLGEATATLVGDRVKVLALSIADRRVTLDILEPGPGDALCCPSRLARKTYALQGSALVPVATTATSSVSLADLAGTEWILVSLGDRPIPAGDTHPPGPPSAACGACRRARPRIRRRAAAVPPRAARNLVAFETAKTRRLPLPEEQQGS